MYKKGMSLNTARRKKDTQNIFRFLGERPLPIQYSRRNQKNGEDREENGGTRRRDTHSSDAPQESLSCRRKLCVPTEQMERAINYWNAYHQDETEGTQPLSSEEMLDCWRGSKRCY